MVRWQGRCVVVVVLAAMVGSVAGQAHVKVNKDRVVVYPPDGRGVVAVRGLEGAITTSSEAAVTVVNQTTQAQGAAALEADGSFVGEVPGVAGEQVRVWARNVEGRRSYGTFDVPALVAVVESGGATGPVEARHEREAAGPPRAEQRQLAVLVMVVDLGTGELVASERAVGVPRGQGDGAELALHTARNIVRRCVQAVQGELRMTGSYGSVEEPVEWGPGTGGEGPAAGGEGAAGPAAELAVEGPSEGEEVEAVEPVEAEGDEVDGEEEGAAEGQEVGRPAS